MDTLIWTLSPLDLLALIDISWPGCPWVVKFISLSTSYIETVTLGWGFKEWGSRGSFMIVQELTNAQGQFHNTVQERCRYFSLHELHGGAMTQLTQFMWVIVKKILPVRLFHSTVGATSAGIRLSDLLIENTKQLILCHFYCQQQMFVLFFWMTYLWFFFIALWGLVGFLPLKLHRKWTHTVSKRYACHSAISLLTQIEISEVLFSKDIKPPHSPPGEKWRGKARDLITCWLRECRLLSTNWRPDFLGGSGRLWLQWCMGRCIKSHKINKRWVSSGPS